MICIFLFIPLGSSRRQ